MFLPPDRIAALRLNAQNDPWAIRTRQRAIDAAAHWLAMSDDQLWHLMFGPTITRSWDVWSTGQCPSCGVDVPLYNWLIEAIRRPWQVVCPHCKDVFPKNDFPAFYRSGLDEHNIFQYALADRSLLFNKERPDPADPLHGYGVDDGEGYVDGERRWRFVGAYLIYGQWKQTVVVGIEALTVAHVFTGEQAYAHKAAILLDRVADLYPSFDHITQAWVEEVVRTEGYVSTWHDACEETRWMVLAYDAIRESIQADAGLAEFLEHKARQFKLPHPKTAPADVCRNIERGLLLDPIKNANRIYSNYPRREIALATIHGVLGGAEHQAKMHAIVDEMLEVATAVDGVTGEKGLGGYSAFVLQSLAAFLAQLDQLAPGTLRDLLRRYPRLQQTFRFHIDTWCMQEYYPQVGDTLWFAAPERNYVGATFQGAGVASDGIYTAIGTLAPSMYEFFWKLYQATGDPAYVQVLYHANGHKLDGLPVDLFAADPAGFQKQVGEVISRDGPDLKLGNVLKEQWRLAILRSGGNADGRAAWLHFDTAGRHGHFDGMNLGLFAKGLDLMPDFGYPPLQISGAGGPHVAWYLATAAHNTVVIDGQNQLSGRYSRDPVGGRCTLWADGKSFAAVRASAPEILAAGLVTAVVELTGPGHEHVGLYLHAQSKVYRVRVLTRPEDGPGDAAWTLTFEDRFDRVELGPDWLAKDGEWRIEGGVLIGHGTLVCTRRFPDGQRLEFEASCDSPTPCDLSAFLGGDGDGFARGAFFGFGSNLNTRSKLQFGGRVAASSADTITPSARHAIVCERSGWLLRHVVDGRGIQEFVNTPEAIKGAMDAALGDKQLERTIIRVDLPASLAPADSYYVDVFRVLGGRDHAKFQHSHFGAIATQGLTLADAPDYGHHTLMRNFKTDPAARPGWSVDWKIEDRNKVLPPAVSTTADIHLRYTDLTTGAAASTCEGWIVPSHFNATEQMWIPRVMVRRTSATVPLASTFVAVIEPYEGQAKIASIRRLALEDPSGKAYGDGHVAIEVRLADGRSDLIIAADVENRRGDSPAFASTGVLLQREWGVRLEGELAVIRRDAAGKVEAVLLGQGREVGVGAFQLTIEKPVAFAETNMEDGVANRAQH